MRVRAKYDLVRVVRVGRRFKPLGPITKRGWLVSSMGSIIHLVGVFENAFGISERYLFYVYKHFMFNFKPARYFEKTKCNGELLAR